MKKIIIAAGGKGTRVHDLTGSVIPKGLCRISEKVNRTILSYQLGQIKDAGFTDVFLIFEHDWQVALFKQLQRIKEVPDLEYIFMCMKWEHPLVMFEHKEVLDFIGTDDFILTYGDLCYSKDLLTGMQELGEKNDTSVACLMHSTSDRWKDGEKKVTFSKDDESRVVKIDLTQNGSFTLHAPFFFQNRALGYIFKELTCNPPRTIPLLKRLIEMSQLSVYDPEFLLNMNKIEDIQIMEEAILKYGNR